jgi:cell division protease FtsH
MTKELLEIEVISGKRVQEFIEQTGKVVYKNGDLHQEKESEEDKENKNEEK